VRKGVPGHKFPLPMIPGTDVAGEIVELGSLATGFKLGDRVAVMPGFADPLSEQALSGQDNIARDYGIFGETRNGGCAEFLDAPARNLLRLPASMSFSDAAACPLAFLTAWTMLKKARLRPTETVLMHAAGSGVTSAGIQLAKLIGAQVIATAGTNDKLEKARKLGADHVINYRGDWVEEVKKYTQRAGVDVVFDHVGPDTFDGDMKVIKWGGRYVTCGSTTGGEVKLNMRALFFKRISLIGSTMGPKADQIEVWKLLCSGKVKPLVDRVFAMRDIRAAHEYVESRKAFGKVVLDATQW
jgi:NADPH:quinone reductase-like Zn-dependent oxidoreductase